MFAKLEDFIFNKVAGKVLARAAVTVAGYLASGVIGVHVNIDPNELTAAVIAGAHTVYEWIKAKRAKNPHSPAVQTDSSKPGYVAPPNGGI